MFFKLRVALRDEWDENSYQKSTLTLQDVMKQGLLVDGLHHFMSPRGSRKDAPLVGRARMRRHSGSRESFFVAT